MEIPIPQFIFLFCVCFYLVGRILLGIYFNKKFNKLLKQNNLQGLRSLEKEFCEKSFLWHMYPVSTTFLSRIKKGIKYIHQKTRNSIEPDPYSLLLEAKDEYENLNELITSEDDEEYV